MDTTRIAILWPFASLSMAAKRAIIIWQTQTCQPLLITWVVFARTAKNPSKIKVCLIYHVQYQMELIRVC